MILQGQSALPIIRLGERRILKKSESTTKIIGADARNENYKNSNLPKNMEKAMQTVTMNKEQAQVFAAAIRPQIKAYIAANREKFEAWLQSERDSELADHDKYDKR